MEPERFGHGVDQADFGSGSGLMFLGEVVQELRELSGILGGEQGEAAVVARESVGSAILRGDGLANLGFRAGGFLRVFAIGGEAGGGDFRKGWEGTAGFGDFEKWCDLGGRMPARALAPLRRRDQIWRD